MVVAAFLAGAFLVVVVLTVFSSTTGSTSLASSVGVSEVLTETVLVAVFKENTFGPLSPSSFCTNPCFLAESCPRLIASAIRFKTNFIVFDESSFIGIKFVKFVGLLFVSTSPYTGIPIFIAS